MKFNISGELFKLRKILSVKERFIRIKNRDNLKNTKDFHEGMILTGYCVRAGIRLAVHPCGRDYSFVIGR